MSNSYEEFFKSLEAFKLAVYNGQTRLALENLVPVIDTIVEILADDDEDEKESETPVKTEVTITNEAPVEKDVTEEPKNEKAPAKKTQKEQE
jgi:hypothetical protein